MSKIWLKLSTKIAFPLLVVWLSCAWYFHVWTWYDVQTCMMMSKECHPVWRPLFLRQIRVGQNLDKVIASTNPKRIERYGEFTRLSYQGGLAFTGVSIIARKDRLIQASAWSCTWTRVLFDKLSKADEEAFEIAYKAYVETILKKKIPEQKPSPPPTVSPPKTVSDSF
jgi:hypothetical protein